MGVFLRDMERSQYLTNTDVWNKQNTNLCRLRANMTHKHTHTMRLGFSVCDENTHLILDVDAELDGRTHARRLREPLKVMTAASCCIS